jgi:hypothetical protein
MQSILIFTICQPQAKRGKEKIKTALKINLPSARRLNSIIE